MSGEMDALVYSAVSPRRPITGCPSRANRQPREFSIKKVSKPQIGPEDILLKVDIAGVCGTDVSPVAPDHIARAER